MDNKVINETMIQTVIKRDGRVVGFNEEKISTAIRKAMLHTDKGEDLQLIRRSCRSNISYGSANEHGKVSFRTCRNELTGESERRHKIYYLPQPAALPAKPRRVICFWRL